jgi:hypothetical protein
MMAVCDKRRHQPVLRKLAPDGVRVTRKLRGDSITQVRGKPGARFDRAQNLLVRGMRVSQRNMDTAPNQTLNVLFRTLKVRRERDDADEPSARLLPPIEFLERREGEHVRLDGPPEIHPTERCAGPRRERKGYRSPRAG